MLHKIQQLLPSILILGCILISSTIYANSGKGLLSDENFIALKNNPDNLFSKVNTCRLKHYLGEKNFDLFNQSMALMTYQDDLPNYLTITGNVRGLFTIFEGFYRMSATQKKVWIAYLFDDKVHYFTNDETSLKNPPQIMLDWSSRFKEAKWLATLLKIESDNCQ